MLAKLEPLRMAQRSKYFSIKCHWFREHVKIISIGLNKIDTKDQLLDTLTKGLLSITFQKLIKC